MFDVDRGGNFYVREVAVARPQPGTEWPFVLLKIDTSGSVLARIPVPKENRAGTGAVLYTPDGPNYYFDTSTRSAWSPLGYFVTGRNDAYAIELRDTTGVIGRFERDYEPVALSGEEKAQWEAWADLVGRSSPGDRPHIPDVKPAFRDIAVGDEGLIWVKRHVAAVYREQQPREPGDDRPLLSWREPVTCDVFEPDGTFLSTVVIPDDTWVGARRGRELWGVQEGNEGAQIVRYEVRPRRAGRGKS